MTSARRPAGTMKAAITGLSETRKRLDVEIPAEQVDESLDRLARRYGRRAKVSGFRPGKAPVRIIRQRFKQDLLHDVAHDLVPPAVDEALRNEQLTPIDTPDVRDVSVDEGQPLTFHALFEVLPSIEGLDYDALTLRRTLIVPDAAATDKALDALRRRASQLEPVTGRPVEPADIVTLDMTRREVRGPDQDAPAAPDDQRTGVTVELGSTTNPPAFDDELIGVAIGQSKQFELSPADGHDQTAPTAPAVAYAVTVRAIHRRTLPDLDDAFAKTVGGFETLEALRERVAVDLRREAESEADHSARRDLMTQLASRVTIEVPEALVNREVARRLDQIANRLAQRRVDPRTVNVDWDALGRDQRAPATDEVRGSLLLDEIARRETITVSDEDVDQEVARYAERLGQTPAATRAQLDKDDGIAAIAEGLRREKAIEFLLSRATIVTV